MADTKISGLPAANTPLTGLEAIPVVQGGVTKQMPPTALTDGRPTNASVVKESGYDVLSQLDVGSEPNQVPLNGLLGRMAFQSPDSLVIEPQALVVPSRPGSLVLQLTNDTTLELKVRGSDGTVRGVTLTLA